MEWWSTGRKKARRKEREKPRREKEKKDSQRIAHGGCPYESGVIKAIREERSFLAARNEQLRLSGRLCADHDGDTPSSKRFLEERKCLPCRIRSTRTQKLVYPRINGSLTPRRRQRGVKQRGIRVIGAAIMTRDAGKCYIELKETGKNLSRSNVARFDARSLLSVVRPE